MIEVYEKQNQLDVTNTPPDDGQYAPAKAHTPDIPVFLDMRLLLHCSPDDPLPCARPFPGGTQGIRGSIVPHK